jgi:hypothetical protein
VVGLALFALGVIVACDRDPPTAPPPGRHPPNVAPMFDADPSTLPTPEGAEVPYGFTATLGITDPVNGSAHDTLGEVPRWLVARMTVRQRVTQSGGGRGEIVAGPRGRYVIGFWDNRCVLEAGMYFQYSNGTGDGFWPGSWGCPSDDLGQPAQETSGLFRIATGATVYATRAHGSAHLCDERDERPCYTYGGSTTFLFTPSTDAAVVTASPAGVVEGSSVTFTASVNGVPVTTVAGWVWRSMDPNVPARTIACATTNGTCTTQVFEDGWMFAHVVIQSFLHTAHAGVAVTPLRLALTASTTTPTYGDNVVYTAAPDPAGGQLRITSWLFRPDAGTQPPTTPCDTTNPCNDVVRTSGTMWVYGTLNGRPDSGSVHVGMKDPDLVVSCPATVTRGSTLTCKIYLSRPVAFTLLSRQSGGAGFTVLSEPRSSHAAGDTARWTGPGVADTRVAIQALLEYGKVVTGNGSFIAAPRAWNAWRLLVAPITKNEVVGQMPPHIAGDSATIAGFYLNDIDTLSISVARVPFGPDSGLAYVATQPTLPRPTIYYHPDLQSGSAWYKDQNGKGSGTCKATSISNRLWPELRRHEGETMSDISHFRVANDAFFALRPDLEIERMVSAITDDNFLRSDVQLAFAAWRDGPHHQRQQQFDREDYPKIWNNLACSLDLNPLDP